MALELRFLLKLIFVYNHKDAFLLYDIHTGSFDAFLAELFKQNKIFANFEFLCSLVANETCAVTKSYFDDLYLESLPKTATNKTLSGFSQNMVQIVPHQKKFCFAVLLFFLQS